jgi:subtilisin family serine protease
LSDSENPFILPSMHRLGGPVARAGQCLIFLLLGFCLPAVGEQPFIEDTPIPGRWLVKAEHGTDARVVARSAGATYVESLAGVDGYHRMQFPEQAQAAPFDRQAIRARIAQKLAATPAVVAFEQEQMLVRYPRRFNPADPLFPDQWHHENSGQSGGLPFADAATREAWDLGLSGNGVVIAIIDTGIEYLHPDLFPNWLNGLGYDYNDQDTDPSPVGFEDRHGTAVAGISMAASNSTGGLGLAYRSKLVPLRLIAGPFESGDEAVALSYRRDTVDIYNNSWGPSDQGGVRYARASEAMRNAVEANVGLGRGGLGNIYVWAAGNGGLNGDNSNYDGYNSLPYTISVGAIGQDDVKAGYSEPGANLLVSAPSGGSGAGILTTDNTGESGYDPGDSYANFSGTSAAAPIVSGAVALMLEARPTLNWRDVQQILAMTAVPVDFLSGGWDRNGSGLLFNHNYGFGRVDAAAAVKLASGWRTLPSMQSVSGSENRQKTLQLGVPSEGGISLNGSLRVQFVNVTLRMNHPDWGDLRVELISPSGTRSVLAEPHPNANSQGEPGNWTYLSTRHLGERASGTWRLVVTDLGPGNTGVWIDWAIEILGHPLIAQTNASPEGEDLLFSSSSYPIEIDVLEGVTDPNGDPLELLSLQAPPAGELVDLGNGRFSYSMTRSKTGQDVFSVLVSDGKGGALRRIISIQDPRPVANDDFFTIQKGSRVDLPVLSNDRDLDNDPLRIIFIGGNGAEFATITDNGMIRFSPPPDLEGVLRLRYSLTDDSEGVSSGWITIVIQESPDLALQFDGEDDFLRLPPTTGVQLSDKFTAEAWIYPESYGEYVTGFGRIYDRDTFVFFLNGFDHSFYSDRSLVLFMVTNDGRQHAVNSAAGTIQLNKWQHVAVSYDSSVSDGSQRVKMYVNGQPVAVSYPTDVSPVLPSLPIGDNSTSPLYVGESSSGARAFRGRMSEFRIWDLVRSPASILVNHDKRITGSEPGLGLYFPLTETLQPLAYSTGSYKGVAEIFGAERVPMELPWAQLSLHFDLVSNIGTGWWKERTLGWLFGDYFPWVYSLSFGWIYAGHEPGAPDKALYFASGPLGWMQTKGSQYPWFHRYQEGNWLWHANGTFGPTLFYDPALRDWVGF